MPRPILAALAWLFCASFPVLAFAASARSSAAYQQRLVEARALAAEGSHALAREKFVAARALAPTDDERRWCQLWTLQQDRAADSHRVDLARISTELAALLEPYEKHGAPRDAFWAAAKSLTGQFDALLTVANFWAEQAVSPNATAAFAQSLLALVRPLSEFAHHEQSLVRDAIELLRAGLASPALADVPERAELTLFYARALQVQQFTLQLSSESIAAAYDAARTATDDTAFAAEARLYEADWLLHHAVFSRNVSIHERTPNTNTRPAPFGSAEDYTRLFTLLDRALDTAPAQPRTHRLATVIASLRAQRTELAKPTLQIETARAYLPESRFSFDLIARHIAQLELQLFRVDLDVLHQLAFASAKPTDTATALERIKPFHTWMLSTGISGGFGRVSSRHSWRDPLEPGAYVLVARNSAGAIAAPLIRWFLVTKVQAVAQQVGGGNLEVGVFDQDTGRLPTPVRGTAWRENASRPLVAVEPGRATLSLRDLPPSWRPLHILGEAAGHPFVIEQFSGAHEANAPLWRFHLLADRPLYQPGETAQWKLTVRQLVDGELRTPAAEKLSVTAECDDTELGSWDITLNEFGSTSGKLLLPTAISPGRVSFTIKRPGDSQSLHTIEAFRVDHFRAPEATFTLEPVDVGQIRHARAGGQVELKVRARYFSGEPLARANIAASVYFRKYVLDFHRTSPPPAGSFPTTLRFTTTTDAQGEATLRIPLHSALPPHAAVQVAAQLNAPGISSNATFGFTLLPHGYFVEIAPGTQTKPRLNRTNPFDVFPTASARVHAWPAQPLALRLFAHDGRVAPAQVKGELVIQRLTWEEIWRTPNGELLTGDALRDRRRRTNTWPPRELGWEMIRSDYRREPVVKEPTATDAKGESTVTFPALPAGYYHVLFQPDDPIADQPEPAALLELFVADASTSWLDYHATTPTLIPIALTPGDPARALAILPDEGRHALASIGGRIGGESRLEAIGGNTRLLEFPWQSGYWAGVNIGLSVLTPHQPSLAYVALEPSRYNHAAQLTLSPSATATRPGEKGRIRIHATDARGQPLVGEIALGVTDAAVSALLEERNPALADSFLGREYVSISSAFSARPQFTGATRPADSVGGELHNEPITLSPFSVASPGEGFSASAVGARPQSVRGTAVAGAGENVVQVRGTFAYTAFWAPDLRTDEHGVAEVEFTYPDNLTEWRIAAEAIGADHRFGRNQIAVQSTLPLQARLRLPRSVVAGDRLSLSGVVLNATAQPVAAKTAFESLTPDLLRLDAPREPGSLALPASGESGVAINAHASAPGQSLVRLSAGSDAHRDAMELTLPIAEDGFLQRTAVTSRVAERSVTVNLALPSPLDPARTKVALQLSPGIVPALVDALPYLVDYPYGCVEQTMSRFLPAVIVAKLLHELGFDPAAVEQRIMPTSAPSSSQHGRVSHLGQLDAVMTRSLARLQQAQNADGSFGWFPQGPGDPYMTAYVLRGLAIAAHAGMAVQSEMTARTFEATLRFLENRATFPQSPAHAAWLLSSVAPASTALDAEQRLVLTRAFDDLYAIRDTLSSAGLALLTQTAAALGRHAEIAVLRRNLENGVVRGHSAEFGATAQWGQTARFYDGLDGAIEATALSLQALLAIDPKSPLIDAAATWLLVNRQSGRWTNTRDTALAVLALHDYARARGDLAGSGRYRVAVNGHVVADRTFDRASLLNPSHIDVEPRVLRAGRNRIEVTRLAGTTPCFLVASAESWAQAATTRPAGEFLRLAREYARIVDEPTVIGHTQARTVDLPTINASVTRSDRVECRLKLRAQQDLEYIAIIVPKPGGCEPLNPLSGWDATLRPVSTDAQDAAQQGQRLYREEHPDRSVFFLPKIHAGEWEIHYTMRATFAGDYRALPATVEAMYVPAITGNTDARRLVIQPNDSHTAVVNRGTAQ